MLRQVLLQQRAAFMKIRQINMLSALQHRAFSEKGPDNKDESPKKTSIFGNAIKQSQNIQKTIQPDDQSSLKPKITESKEPIAEPSIEFKPQIYFDKGEYVDFDQNLKIDPTDAYLSQKVGSFQWRRSHSSTHGAFNARIDEIFDVEVTKETKLEVDSSLSQIQQKYQSFDFGQKSESAKQIKVKAPQNFNKINQMLENILDDASKNLDKTISIQQPSLIEISQQKLANSAFKKEVDLVWDRLLDLRERLGKDALFLNKITKQDISNSSQIRKSLIEFNVYHFMLTQNPDKSFKREYNNEREKKISSEQSILQSDRLKHQEVALEVSLHNYQKIEEASKPEEGIDNLELPENVFDPMKVNIKKLEREIKNELKELALDRPAVAERYSKFLFSKDTDVDIELAKPPVPLEEIKLYPGSIKGPMPEDDPENYSRWWYEHQPNSLKENGVLNVDELGIKKKLVRGERESVYHNEIKTPAEYFFEVDEQYPMVNTNKPPEFEIFDRDNFNVINQDDLPAVTFSSMMELHELAPQTTDNTINYWRYHAEQEPWAIFRALPELVKYDKAVIDFFKGIANGILPIPQFMEKTNPPSLWAYYLTLPSWCRQHSLIYNMVHAFEYHQPAINFRQKELAMNFACSFLRPIEGRLRDVIIEVASSKKIRLNIELGKIMVNEQKFYELDPAELGDSSDDVQEGENELIKLLTKGLDEEEKKTADVGLMIEKLVGGLGYEQRMKEREKILISEQNIDKFQFEAATEEVLSDFPVKPYAKVDDIQSADAVQHEPLIPCNFYDNDDGFWNDYINYKQQRWQDAGMITHRKFFKH